MNNTITINDKYSHLSFKPPCLSSLEIGQMVQVLENNTIPLSWQWVELTSKDIVKLQKLDATKWVRVPNY